MNSHIRAEAFRGTSYWIALFLLLTSIPSVLPLERGHVTVCICSGGTRLPTLEQVLGALDVQTLDSSAYEVVVVGNPPSKEQMDAMEELVRKVQSTSSTNFKFLPTSERGLGLARNQCLEKTNAEFIAYLDDDAVPKSNHLLDMIEGFRAYPKAAVIGGKIQPALPLGQAGSKGVSSATKKHLTSAVDFGKRPLKLKWPKHVLGANIAFRTELLRSIGGFHPYLGYSGPLKLGWDENHVTTTLMSKGFDMVYLPSIPVLHYVSASRLSPGQVTLRAHSHIITKAVLHFIMLGLDKPKQSLPKAQDPYAYTTGLIDTLKTYQCISPLMVYAFCSAVSRRAPLLHAAIDLDRLRLKSDASFEHFLQHPPQNKDSCGNADLPRLWSSTCTEETPPKVPLRFTRPFRCKGSHCYFQSDVAKAILGFLEPKSHIVLHQARQGQYSRYFLQRGDGLKVESYHNSTKPPRYVEKWSTFLVQHGLTFYQKDKLAFSACDWSIALHVRPGFWTTTSTILPRMAVYTKKGLILSTFDGSAIPPEMVSKLAAWGYHEDSAASERLRAAVSAAPYRESLNVFRKSEGGSPPDIKPFREPPPPKPARTVQRGRAENPGTRADSRPNNEAELGEGGPSSHSKAARGSPEESIDDTEEPNGADSIAEYRDGDTDGQEPQQSTDTRPGEAGVSSAVSSPIAAGVERGVEDESAYDD